MPALHAVTPRRQRGDLLNGAQCEDGAADGVAPALGSVVVVYEYELRVAGGK